MRYEREKRSPMPSVSSATGVQKSDCEVNIPLHVPKRLSARSAKSMKLQCEHRCSDECVPYIMLLSTVDMALTRILQFASYILY
jgi:hypothetical protein